MTSLAPINLFTGTGTMVTAMKSATPKAWFSCLSLAVLIATFCLPSARIFAANASYSFSYSGRLTESSGRPVNGPVSLSVSFYQTSTGGTPVLTVTEGLAAVALQEGIFQISLVLSGSDFHQAFPSVFDKVYVEITDLTNRPDKPYDRQLVAMVPYAAKIPVDDKSITFDSQGRATLAVSGSAASGKLISADGSGGLVWIDQPATNVTTVGGVSAANVAAGANAANAASSSSTALTIVKRDSNGGFTADNVVASPTSAARTGLVVKGAASQSASLQEWQDTNGTALTAIDASGTLKFKDNDGSANYVGLKAPSNAASDVTYTLPAAPVAGYYLQTDGTGTLSWASPSGSGNMNTSTYDLNTNGVVDQSEDGQKFVNGSGWAGSAPATQTTLSANLAAGATTATVVSTTSYPETGLLLIGNEVISYSGKTATTFTGLTRARYGTADALHTSSTAVGNILLSAATSSATAKLVVTDQGRMGLGTVKPGAVLEAVSPSNIVGHIVRGSSGQTLDLQQWQANDGTVLSAIDSSGALALKGNGANYAAVKAGSSMTGNLSLTLPSTAGASGNVLQTDGAGVLSWVAPASSAGFDSHASAPSNSLYVDSGGKVGFSTTTTSGGDVTMSQLANGDTMLFAKRQTDTAPSGNFVNFKNAAGATSLFSVGVDGSMTAATGKFQVDSNGVVGINASTPGAQLEVGISAAGTKGLIIKSAASQTANLQEWQNSAGTTLMSIDPAGNTTTSGNLAVGNGIFGNFAGHSTSDFSLWSGSTGNLTLQPGAINPAATQGKVDLRLTKAGGGVVTGLGQNSQVTLGANLDQSDVIIKRNVTGAFAENGALLQLQKDVTGSSTYGSNYLKWGTTAADLGVIDESGNLGIGTTAPAAKIEVHGDSSGKGVIVKANATTPGNLQEWQNSSGTALLYVDGAGVLRGNSAVVDSVQAGAGPYTSMSSNFTVGSNNMYGFSNSAGGGTGATLDANFSRLAASKVALGNGTQGDYSGTLAVGSVGIGTTAPVDALSIGTAPTASATRALLNLSNTALSSASASGTYVGANPASAGADFINYQVNGTSQFRVDNVGTVNARAIGLGLGIDGAIQGSAGQSLVLRGGSGTNSMTINGTGSVVSFDSTVNVGVGTTTPVLKLDVNGSARVKASATSVLTGSIDPDGTTTVTGVGTLFSSELAVGDRITVSAETRTVTAIASNTSLTVDTAFTDTANDASPDRLPADFIVTSSSGTVAAIVRDDGNVGIGTAAPAAPLDVVSGGTSLLRVSTTSGPGKVLASSSTLANSVPQNGSVKACYTSVTLRAGQSVSVTGALTLMANGVNSPAGTETTLRLARDGTNLTPFDSVVTHLYYTTHQQTWVDTPGAGTFEYQVYGAETANRTNPTNETCFIQVTSLN